MARQTRLPLALFSASSERSLFDLLPPTDCRYLTNLNLRLPSDSLGLRHLDLHSPFPTRCV